MDEAIGDLEFSKNTVLGNETDGYDNITDAVDDLNVTVGDMNFMGTTHIANSTTVTDALVELDGTIGNLTFNNLSSGYTLNGSYNDVTAALQALNTALGNGNFQGTNYLQSVDFQSNGMTGALVTLDKTLGNVSTELDTLQQTVDGLSGRVADLENRSSTQSNSLSENGGIESSAAETAAESNPTEATAAEASSAAPVPNSITSGVQRMAMKSAAVPLSAPVSPLANDSPVTPPPSDNHVYTNGDTTYIKNKDVQIDGDLTVNGDTTMNGSLDMKDHTITGVKDGKISADSTEAINGSQLYETNQKVAENAQNIGILGSAVNKLGDRIERVGAGAAALAALHPLDFDPDNKLDFAAGFGNYRGASAVAVGAFYRPSENVMFSVGGAFGGGEDMVNAGVSFKVGAGSGSATTSRTAMAKSLKSMQEVVATQDAQLAQQREQIEKLTAMVELLMEQSGQTQPKDDGADTAQPQQ